MANIKSISLLIPTLNEAENIPDLIGRIIESLRNVDINYEIVIIDDDSKDQTADIAQNLLKDKGRVIRREAKDKSLGLSVVEGIKQTKTEAILVMDADLSHPPEILPIFIEQLNKGYDLIIGSRYVKGGGTKDFPLIRRIISKVACLLGRLITPIKDNTSGFFAIKRSALQGIELNPKGFKIGLEVFVKGKINSFKEVPFIFVNRKKGKSKLTSKPILQYLEQINSLKRYKCHKEKY